MTEFIEFRGTFYNEFVNQQNERMSFPVAFTMKVTMNNGSFEGTRIDEETIDLIKDPIKVKGFVEDDFISFTIDYPRNYYIDPDSGKTVIMDEPHPGVVYEGYYDTSSQQYSGEYSVVIDENRVGPLQSDYLQEEIFGSWVMEKIKTSHNNG